MINKKLMKNNKNKMQLNLLRLLLQILNKLELLIIILHHFHNNNYLNQLIQINKNIILLINNKNN